MIQLPPSPLQLIDDPLLKDYPVKLYIKRDDLIHPEITGNKWRKLKYNLIEAREKGFKSLMTFGGAFSNHIYATSAAGKRTSSLPQRTFSSNPRFPTRYLRQIFSCEVCCLLLAGFRCCERCRLLR